ncbi:MAG: alkaline phosphatase family protein [Gemmatimonadaceae bacterium]|nr:alkaline phosphatase family protein [Gemmatimonadaceae bacterium]
MSTPATKVLVLGIDAASPDLLDEWIADGSLPNLAALAARGLVARTRGIEGFFVGSTWASFYTGTNPSRHGLHYQMQLVPGSYRLEDRARGTFVEGDPFWRAVSRAGKRVAVLDVPLAKLEPELHGVQVVEWGAHDAFFGFATNPPELAAEIEARTGKHTAASSCDAPARDAGAYIEFVAALEEGVRRKGIWSAELLARGNWDLFMQVFTESHCVGHQCWHLHDVSHPAHEPHVAAATGDPLRTVYRAIDCAIGELVATAGDAQIVVFAAHGMSHRFGAHFLLRDILCALGVAARTPRSLGERLREEIARVWRALPTPVRATLAPLRDRAVREEGVRVGVPATGVDVDRSRCFPLANGLAVSGIRLNLVGREPRGTLAPGDEEARFVAQLQADLLAIVDEVSGAPLVKRVIRTRGLYEGEHLDSLPDLLVEWNDAVARGSTALGSGAGARVRATSNKLGVVEGANDYGRSGEHRPGGWLVAAGPGVEHGRLSWEPSLLDLAPTIAGMMGVELPDAAGDPIAAIGNA